MLLLSIIMSFVINLSANTELNIVYTNDLEGTVNTCGCATDPGGGTVRRVNWFNSLKLDPKNTVYINAGSTLFSDLASLPHEDKKERFGAQIMAESLKMMNISAYTPGSSDFKKGLATFNTLSKSLPLVLTNSDDNKHKKNIELKKANKKILVLGVVQMDKIDPAIMLELKLNDPVKALKAELKKIDKKEKPYTILLLYSNEELLKNITKQVKGIDLVLSAGIKEELPLAQKQNNSNVIRLLNGGDSIGLIKIDSLKNKITFLGSEFEKPNKLSSKIKKYERMKI